MPFIKCLFTTADICLTKFYLFKLQLGISVGGYFHLHFWVRRQLHFLGKLRPKLGPGVPAAGGIRSWGNYISVVKKTKKLVSKCLFYFYLFCLGTKWRPSTSNLPNCKVLLLSFTFDSLSNHLPNCDLSKKLCNMKINENTLAAFATSRDTPVQKEGWLWKKGELNPKVWNTLIT